MKITVEIEDEVFQTLATTAAMTGVSVEEVVEAVVANWATGEIRLAEVRSGVVDPCALGKAVLGELRRVLTISRIPRQGARKSLGSCEKAKIRALVSSGVSRREVARRYGIDEKTVRNYL